MPQELSQVLRDTHITYATLEKYKNLGLIPKPVVMRKGLRGGKSLWPNEVIGLIHQIEILKAKGFTLEQIGTMLKNKISLTEEEIALSGESNPDPITTFMGLGAEVDRRYPDYDVIHAEGKVEKRGNKEVVIVSQVVLTPKPGEAAEGKKPEQSRETYYKVEFYDRQLKTWHRAKKRFASEEEAKIYGERFSPIVRIVRKEA